MNLTERVAAVTLKVAVLRVRSDQLAKELGKARVEAEKVYAVHRLAGNKSVTPVLPGGAEAGTLSIERGAIDVAFDEAELFALVQETDPSNIEEYVETSVLRDKRVFDLIREHFPEMVQQRVSPARRAELAEVCEETNGVLLNTVSGAKVRVATVSRHEPTGKFSYTPGTKGTATVLQALKDGTVTEDGRVVPATAREGGPE
jgi:hypothetical protein